MKKHWLNFILVWLFIAVMVGFGVWWYGVHWITAVIVFMAIVIWAVLVVVGSTQTSSQWWYCVLGWLFIAATLGFGLSLCGFHWFAAVLVPGVIFIWMATFAVIGAIASAIRS